MRILITALILAFACCSCDDRPAAISGSKDAEREHPDDYVKVNYEVHRNLLGKKIIEGKVLNTGKHLTYKSVTLKIESIKDDDHTSVNYTVSEAVAPGGHADFKYKPEGNPDRVKVSVAAATVD